MGKEFDLTPRTVPLVTTKYRRVATQLPHPESVATIERLQRFEPRSMSGQPPVVWHEAEDFVVRDRHGNQWLDWTSGVLVANVGHSAPEVRDAIIEQARSGLLHHYCFAAEPRAELVERLARLAPPGLDKVFLLTTGSEAVECAIKLCRARGREIGGPRKIGIIGFERGFHGRTLGSQQAGGIPGLKTWIGNLDPGFITVPFPDGYWQADTRFDTLTQAVAAAGLAPGEIAGVIMESYQGVGPDFAPPAYVTALVAWCREHQITLVFDEVQAGFGRTGRMWAFEHYGVTPDLICCGKGITSSLPLSAVLGRAAIMDLFPPGSMTSTHTGNPLCCVAALACLEKLERSGLVANAGRLGPVLEAGLQRLQAAHPEIVGRVSARGLVGGVQMVKPGTKTPDHDHAHDIVLRCFQKGLLIFSPVGAWGQTVKIAPPLTTPADALEEGLEVLAEAVRESVSA